MAEKKIPVVLLNSGHKMPVIGMGTSVENKEAIGVAVAKAIDKGLKKSREEVFITSKPWNTDAQRDLIVPALKTTLRKLREFCKKQGINVSAWSAYGAYKVFWGSGAVMENPILQDIAKDKGVRKYDTF
ncbi:Methylecgonone reductase [Vigna angularis]|uniref:Methylecgonone reductase n=1 Tax=Phaseolus angularis TaxID=3914 RepID=A0A8T0JZL1_PHAAN|nr:Methylecgonone reductase [Vigna angularis]